jgi:tetratricopeptide (TPR) repeat protein
VALPNPEQFCDFWTSAAFRFVTQPTQLSFENLDYSLIVAIGARVCLVSMTLLAVQSTNPFGSYRQRIDAYRSGMEVSEADSALRPVDLDETRGWTPKDLEAAAMLHTDIGLRFLKAGRPGDSTQHLDAAAALLQADTHIDPARVEYARRWRDTVAGLLDAYGAHDRASELAAHGHEWWPESKEAAAASKAFGQGLTHEIQAAVAGSLSGPPATRPFAIPGDAISALRHATEEYTAALASDPTNTQIALHIGRVLLLLGRDGEAASNLRAASSSTNPAIRYLALMFTGALEERAGRLDAAIDAYRHAGEAFRWGQSAPLALSHVLMRAARDADARQALTEHFDATRGRVCEPLWTYLADPSTDLGPMLDELRAEVWR